MSETFQKRLQRAVRNEVPPPFLEAKVRNAIAESGRKRSWGLKLVPAGAMALVCLGAGIAYQLGHLRLTSESQETYIASVTKRVGTLMRVGLGDHLHCSVFRKFPKNAPKIEDLGTKLGAEYKPLIPVVRRHLPEEYRLMIAHECGYRGRKFIHLSLKSDKGLVSLVVAKKNEGESFETEGLVPALVQSGIPMYRASAQRFEIASFESRDHLVYFISDLGRGQNTKMMLALAPDVKKALES